MSSSEYLVLSAGAEGVEVVAVGAAGERRTAADRDGLLQAVAAAFPEGKPAGIVVAGVAGRFSESRSVATLANVLAYAWGVKAAATSKPWPTGTGAARAKRALAGARWPLKPAYSGEPNITKPGMRRSEGRPRQRAR